MERALQVNVIRLLSFILISILGVELLGCNGTVQTPTATIQPTASPSPTFTVPPTTTPTSTPKPTLTSSPTPCLPPGTPILNPTGEISPQPGAQVPIRASAVNARSYEWKLSGDGSISQNPTDVIVYTAPDKSGGLAILTVTASNTCGATAPVSLVIHISNFIVSLDTIGIPTGFMTYGTTNPAPYIAIEMITKDCKTDKCYQFTYKPGNVFAGIMWFPPSCGQSGDEAFLKAKGGLCPIKVFQKAGVTPKKLTFWARGDKGGEVVEFKVGAIDIKPSPAESTGPTVLGKAWKQYEIPLAGMNMENAAALFTWVGTDLANKTNAVFYLDSIQFEGS